MERLPQLSTPEGELAYLREQVAKKEAELGVSEVERAHIIEETVREHQVSPPLMAESYPLSPETRKDEASAILAELSLGNGEAAIARLNTILEQKGVSNALSVCHDLKDPHISDDFHRYLVRYIAAGLPVKGIKENAPEFKALHMTLYAIALPEERANDQNRARPLKELVSGMEQLYAGLLAVNKTSDTEPQYFALELAVPESTPELQFYAAVPNSKCTLFEKQVLAIFPDAHLTQLPGDYNIFASNGTSLIATASLKEHPALPLKDYTEFDHDPLHAITNAFSKIASQGEGAALQLIVEPRGDRHTSHYRKILQLLRKGQKKGEALSTPESVLGEVMRDFGKTLFSSTPKDEEKAKEAEARQIESNKSLIAGVERKIASPIVGVTLRILASSSDTKKTDQILGELEAAFNQFANTEGNALTFARPRDRDMQTEFENFSFRLPARNAMPLSLRELTSLYHYPPEGRPSAPHVQQSRFTHAPAPLTAGREGVHLGTNVYRATKTEIYLSGEDRLRHMYIIGQTGTGKSGLMRAMIAQDIANGDGCCYIDPHGSDIIGILASIPPERYRDVIYFDPADISRPLGLNFLEYDASRPEQKTFIVNELLMIFRRLYGDVPESMGPAFEQYFRNATQLVMEDPSSGSTILDIARVLSNAEFRELKLSRSMNPIVSQFWTEIANKPKGDMSLAEIVPYITNKFDDFTANDFLRPIVGQQSSSFNFREVMDSKKILLINLSKGRLGEKNANLLGLILVGKMFMAALSRADNHAANFPPFYLYIDEFQNITTDSIPGILSEARKYKLSLTVAHQFLNQLQDKTRDAIFGNVGNMCVFRVGEEDAEFFAKQYAPVFETLDFVNIENMNAYVKILERGIPQKPFDIQARRYPNGNPEQVKDLMELSALTYGRDRATVEADIRERYITK